MRTQHLVSHSTFASPRSQERFLDYASSTHSREVNAKKRRRFSSVGMTGKFIRSNDRPRQCCGLEDRLRDLNRAAGKSVRGGGRDVIVPG
jgi:hypothetical protein